MKATANNATAEPLTLQMKFLTLADASARLGISKPTFRARWSEVFTDWRTPSERKRGRIRPVAIDELEIAIENGGQDRARAAVLEFRKRNRRA